MRRRAFKAGLGNAVAWPVARGPLLLWLSLLGTGCSLQRAQVANEAQTKMVGLSKEQVLACMGTPQGRAAEGMTEVWSYGSGDGRTTVGTFAGSTTNASVTGGANYSSGSATTTGSGFGVATQRNCTVHVVITDGRVSRVNYSGPTGGVLTKGEQCAYAVENCVR